MDYIFLQNYWWFLVSLLGALLVFLLFVQGGNSLLFTLGRTHEERTMLVNSTGRKWEFTFTTLVTFGGAFFASFPLFYSTSFGGAYWLWMIIMFTFVLQAVSYEFQSKLGNILGKRTYQWFLVINGVVGPLLLGGAVATFFTGSNFLVNKGNMGNELMPVISSWANGWHGLDALTNPWNLVLGFAVFFLARLLGNLYFINNIRDKDLIPRCRRQLITDAIPFPYPVSGFRYPHFISRRFRCKSRNKGNLYGTLQVFPQSDGYTPIAGIVPHRSGRGSLGHWKSCIQQDCHQWYLVCRSRCRAHCISFITLRRI